MKKKYIDAGAISRVHVNMHVIRANRKWNRNDPPLTIKNRGKNIKAHDITIHGMCKVIHNAKKPLSCGARVWIETKAGISIGK